MLSKEQLHEILTYRNGELYWKKCKMAYLNGVRAGSARKATKYRFISIINKLYAEHRIIYTMFYGDIPPGYEIDHIDTDRENNKISNLRICTRTQNAQNTPMKSNRTGYKGVGQSSKNLYYYTIRANGEIFIKRKFKSALLAYEARNKLVKKLHGEFCNISCDGKK